MVDAIHSPGVQRIHVCSVAEGAERPVTPEGQEEGRQVREAAQFADRAGPGVLLVRCGEVSSRILEERLEPVARVARVEKDADAIAQVERHRPSVVCMGRGVEGESAVELAQAISASVGDGEVQLVILAGGEDLSRFQGLLDADRLYWLSRSPLGDEDVGDILLGALARTQGRRVGVTPSAVAGFEDRAPVLETILAVAERVAMQEDLESAGELASEALRELVDAERAYCLIYDRAEQVLWSREPNAPGERRESAAVGLVSLAAQTGRTVVRRRARDDANYEPEADDPQGSGDEAFVALPVADGLGEVHAVLVAVRRPPSPSFSEDELVRIQTFADLLGSSFKRLSLRAQIDTDTSRLERAQRAGTPFRDEALEHYSSGLGERGEALRLSPRWVSTAHVLLLLLVLATIVVAVMVEVPAYVRGPAMARLDGDEARVIALLPLQDARGVHRGDTLTFQPAGEGAREHSLVVSQVGSPLVDPREASSALDGRDLGGLSLPAVRVEAIGPSGRDEGAASSPERVVEGTAVVEAGTERVLFVLFPDLKSRWKRSDGE
jgi:hypothetical protein